MTQGRPQGQRNSRPKVLLPFGNPAVIHSSQPCSHKSTPDTQQPARNGAKRGVSASGSGVAAFMLELEALDVRVEERRLANGLCGFYYAPLRLIVLDSGLADFQHRCTLCHELIHAQYGDTGCGALAGIKAERRTRRETALRLVDPVEYATAERVFEGDVWRIACELDVTVQVVRDYQNALSQCAAISV